MGRAPRDQGRFEDLRPSMSGTCKSRSCSKCFDLIHEKPPAQMPPAGGFSALCDVDNLKPSLAGVVDRVGRTSARTGQGTDAYAAVVYQMAVSSVHTALRICFGHVDNFFGLLLDALVDCLSGSFHFFVWEWHGKTSINRINVYCFFNSVRQLGCHCIKSQCATGAKEPVASVVIRWTMMCSNRWFNVILFSGDVSVAGKTRGFGSHLFILHSLLILHSLHIAYC